MAELRAEPTLKVLQDYLAAVCEERGWTKDSPSEKFVLFVEEIGELAKAIRKKSGLYDEAAKSRIFSLEEEFADVLSYLLDLANCYGVDLEQPSGPRKKSTKRGSGTDGLSQSRNWKVKANERSAENRIASAPGLFPKLRGGVAARSIAPPRRV
jgi:NTP pyrophosphatase (non-canonical NTP hydrolase)